MKKNIFFISFFIATICQAQGELVKKSVAETAAQTPSDPIVASGTQVEITATDAQGAINDLSGKISNVYTKDNLIKHIPQNDYASKTFGTEYLISLHEKIAAGTPVEIYVGGTSQIAYYAGSNSPVDVANNLKIKKGFNPNITFFNGGVSASNTQDFINSKLDEIQARQPACVVISHQINDGLLPLPTRLNIYETNLRIILTALRNGGNGIITGKNVNNLSIVLMTSSATNDVPLNRDSLWYSQSNVILRKLAREYKCGFIDNWNFLNDGNSTWQDSPFAANSNIGIHPRPTANRWIGGAMYNFLFPIGLETYANFGTTSFPTVFEGTDYVNEKGYFNGSQHSFNRHPNTGAINNSTIGSATLIASATATGGFFDFRTSDNVGASEISLTRCYIDRIGNLSIGGVSSAKATAKTYTGLGFNGSNTSIIRQINSGFKGIGIASNLVVDASNGFVKEDLASQGYVNWFGYENNNNGFTIAHTPALTTTPLVFSTIFNVNPQSILIPRRQTIERPIAPTNGMIGYNTTLNLFEWFENGGWVQKQNAARIYLRGTNGTALGISGATGINVVSVAGDAGSDIFTAADFTVLPTSKQIDVFINGVKANRTTGTLASSAGIAYTITTAGLITSNVIINQFEVKLYK